MATLQTLRTSLHETAQGVSGGGFALLSGRCVQGYLPVTRTTGSGFWQRCTAATSGAFAIVGPGACVDADAGNINRYPRFSVEVEVYLAVDKDAADNLSGVVTFIETLRRALDDVLPKGGCTYDPPGMQTNGPNLLLHYRLDCNGLGCG